ncbi:hypothetical protein PL9214640275 [Planktothrix tepida PCC 9214]|uniref:Uncharacterized protein n=1 Tax=Planktothrix tepida PCC 9214 TaxID=671072 RepID=A0A1J1LQX2_9CYAN|nr:hypothetical protein [Planktothrix tepida]CUR34268.1 hypothetical protein PL9214640275 [Planktothrix tepida PCC 9214]
MGYKLKLSSLLKIYFNLINPESASSFLLKKIIILYNNFYKNGYNKQKNKIEVSATVKKLPPLITPDQRELGVLTKGFPG